jgi:hypothetical protein
VRLVDREIKRPDRGVSQCPSASSSLALGTGEYALYQGIRSKEIPSIKVGRKIMVRPGAAPDARLEGDNQTIKGSKVA